MEDQIRAILGPGGALAGCVENYEYRPQQVQMALDVAQVIQNGCIFFSEAGTGTGKSLAYLVPSTFIASPVIVSTGTKNLQEQLFFKDIPLLNKIIDRNIDAVMMKGRNNYLCWQRFHEFLKSPQLLKADEKWTVDRISGWADSTQTGDRSELVFLPDSSSIWSAVCSRGELCSGSRCAYFHECFILRLRMRAQKADIVIINHHLFFADRGTRNEANSRALPDAKAYIFDEAHLLEEIAREFLGIRIGFRDLEEMADLIKHYLPAKKKKRKLADQMSASLRDMLDRGKLFFHYFGAGEGRFLIASRYDLEARRMSESLMNALCSVELNLLETKNVPDEFKDEVRFRLGEMKNRIHFIDLQEDEDQVYWGEYGYGGSTLHANPIEVSGDISKIVHGTGVPFIFTSATLTSNGRFDFVTQALGLQNSIESIYHSPFDYFSQGVLYIPEHLPEPSNRDFFHEAGCEILKILRITEGRAFILSTSNKGVKEISEFLKDKMKYTMLVQGAASKKALIDAFRQDIHSVLVATTSFWQGVDVPGESLSCVIIDKLPFSSPSEPITAAKIDRLKNQGENAFNVFQLPEAVMALKQGVGRLIRRKGDRGVVAILDNRLLRKEYGQVFLRSLPEFRRVKDVGEVEAFFNCT